MDPDPEPIPLHRWLIMGSHGRTVYYWCSECGEMMIEEKGQKRTSWSVGSMEARSENT